MRIKIQQFLFGKSHSWAVVGQNIGREFLKLGHDVELISTDGIELKFIPEDLKKYIKTRPSGKYDLQLSYTAPHNWPRYCDKKLGPNCFCIWNFEFDNKKFDNKNFALLKGFGKYYKDIDLVLPSSNFTKKVFKSMQIPSEKMAVVPHGINVDEYSDPAVKPWPLKTNKSKKILLNIAQPHKRKAIHLALESFGKAFTREDDVCLVAKILKENKTDHVFNVDFDDILRKFKKKFPNHAEIEVIYDYIPNIVSLYKACDINFSATFAECWHLPSLEALASGLINIVPRYGGQLDFCNDENSLLIDGKIVRAESDMLYWQQTPFAVKFKISTNHAAQQLRNAINNYDSLLTKFKNNMQSTVQTFTWKNAAKQILELAK